MAGIKGTFNGTEALIKATDDGELEVRAIVETEIEHASSSGLAFVWTSTTSDIDAGDTRLFIKNTGDKFLILERMLINPANVVCRYDIGVGALTTVPTGVAITPVNMNQQYSNSSESAIAYDDETAVADAETMMCVVCNTTESLQVPIDGIILGKNHYIQINQGTEATSGQVVIVGHFAENLV